MMVLLLIRPIVLAFLTLLPTASSGQVPAPAHFYPYGIGVGDYTLDGQVETVQLETRIVFDSLPRNKLYVRIDIDLIRPWILNCRPYSSISMIRLGCLLGSFVLGPTNECRPTRLV